MQHNPTHVSNPNYDIRCHPGDLGSRNVNEQYLNSLNQPSYAQSIQQACLVARHKHVRRTTLNRLLHKAAAAGDLPGLEHFALYLRDKYRRNCQASTLQLTATSLILFLSFYKLFQGSK